MIIKSLITEVDIKHAAPSIWVEMGKISEEKYNELISMDKKKRVITCGLIQKDDPTLYETLQKGYDKYINLLMVSNNINENMILERVHDALWILDFEPNQLVFGRIEFVLKHTYCVMFKYQKLSFYLVDGSLSLEVRGVSKKKDCQVFLDKIQEILTNYLYEDNDRLYKILHTMKQNLIKDLDYYGPQVGIQPNSNIKIIQNLIKIVL